MGVTIKHHLKVGHPVLTHSHRSTCCEKKARLLALVILFKMTRTVHKKCVCVYEGVEKTFVRFHDFLNVILHVQKFSFSFRCLRATLHNKG